jgi:mRNA interferase MazF
VIYKPFDIVKVPFPFTDKAKSKKRPALVISAETFQKETGHVSLLMITSAKHSKWFGDYLLKNLDATGLSQEVIVRQKIFTMDLRLIEKTIGHLSKKDGEAVKLILQKCIL